MKQFQTLLFTCGCSPIEAAIPIATARAHGHTCPLSSAFYHNGSTVMPCDHRGDEIRLRAGRAQKAALLTLCTTDA